MELLTHDLWPWVFRWERFEQCQISASVSNRKCCGWYLDDFTRGRTTEMLEECRNMSRPAKKFWIAHSIVSLSFQMTEIVVRGFSSDRLWATMAAGTYLLSYKWEETLGRQGEKSQNACNRFLEARIVLYCDQEVAQRWFICRATSMICIINACSLESLFSVVQGTREVNKSAIGSRSLYRKEQLLSD